MWEILEECKFIMYNIYNLVTLISPLTVYWLVKTPLMCVFRVSGLLGYHYGDKNYFTSRCFYLELESPITFTICLVKKLKNFWTKKSYDLMFTKVNLQNLPTTFSIVFGINHHHSHNHSSFPCFRLVDRNCLHLDPFRKLEEYGLPIIVVGGVSYRHFFVPLSCLVHDSWCGFGWYLRGVGQQSKHARYNGVTDRVVGKIYSWQLYNVFFFGSGLYGPDNKLQSTELPPPWP